MNNKGGNPVSTGALSSRWSGNPGRIDTDTKASSGTDGPTVGSRVWEKGRKRATFKSQLFQVSTRGRKEGRKEEGRKRAAAADGMGGASDSVRTKYILKEQQSTVAVLVST